MKNVIRILLLFIPFTPLIFIIGDELNLYQESYNNRNLTLMVIAILNLSAFFYYLYLIISNSSIRKESKINWIVGMVLFANLTQIIYWFKFLKSTVD